MTTNEIFEGTFIAAGGSAVSLDELLIASGLTREEAETLLDFGVLEPTRPASLLFPAQALLRARTAARLRAHFELNAPGMALAVDLLARMEALEARIRQLECQRLK
jgi:chaperone modulatory protein CbpM